jgi:hypothetical protein
VGAAGGGRPAKLVASESFALKAADKGSLEKPESAVMEVK